MIRVLTTAILCLGAAAVAGAGETATILAKGKYAGLLVKADAEGAVLPELNPESCATGVLTSKKGELRLDGTLFGSTKGGKKGFGPLVEVPPGPTFAGSAGTLQTTLFRLMSRELCGPETPQDLEAAMFSLYHLGALTAAAEAHGEVKEKKAKKVFKRIHKVEKKLKDAAEGIQLLAGPDAPTDPKERAKTVKKARKSLKKASGKCRSLVKVLFGYGLLEEGVE